MTRSDHGLIHHLCSLHRGLFAPLLLLLVLGIWAVVAGGYTGGCISLPTQRSGWRINGKTSAGAARTRFPRFKGVALRVVFWRGLV